MIDGWASTRKAPWTCPYHRNRRRRTPSWYNASFAIFCARFLIEQGVSNARWDLQSTLVFRVLHATIVRGTCTAFINTIIAAQKYRWNWCFNRNKLLSEHWKRRIPNEQASRSFWIQAKENLGTAITDIQYLPLVSKGHHHSASLWAWTNALRGVIELRKGKVTIQSVIQRVRGGKPPQRWDVADPRCAR